MTAAGAVARMETHWRPALLADEEPRRRNRRTIDGVFLAAGSIVLGLAAAIASSAATQDNQVAKGLVTVFGWAEGFWRLTFVSAVVLSLTVVVDAFLRRRWQLV